MKNTNCKLCERSKQCKNVCFTVDSQNDIDVLLVIYSISETTDSTNDITKTVEYDLLKYVIQDSLGFDFNRCKISHIVRCGGQSPITEFSISQCIGYLNGDIKRYNPKIIIGFGEEVFNILANKTNVRENRGKVFYYNGFKYINTYDLQQMSKATDKVFRDFCSDINLGLSISEGLSNETLFNEYHVCDTLYEVENLIRNVKKKGSFSFNVKTTGLSAEKDKLLFLGICFQHGYSYAIPIKHRDSPFNEDELKRLIEMLSKEIFSNENIEKYSWNIKFTLRFLIRNGFKISGNLNDGMMIHYLLDENKSHSLRKLAVDTYPALIGYYNEYESEGYAQSSYPVTAKICAQECDVALRLTNLYESKLISDDSLYNYYRNIMIPVFKLLCNMEITGMLIDNELLDKYVTQTNTVINDTYDDIVSMQKVKVFEKHCFERDKKKLLNDLNYRVNNDTLNDDTLGELNQTITEIKTGAYNVKYKIDLDNEKHVYDLLYTEQGFGYIIPSGVKKGFTNNDVLSSLQDTSGFIALYFKYKKYKQILNTLHSIYEYMDDKYVVHSDYSQISTVTGRLSSSNPNLQSITNYTDNVINLKSIFTCPKDYYILQADLNQSELRIIALLSQDEYMNDAYNNGEDLHIRTALLLNNMTFEKWNELDNETRYDLRNKAKAINFGFMYGMSAHGFKKYAKQGYNAEFTIEESISYLEKFNETYKGIGTWFNRSKDFVYKNEYIKSIFGKVRNFPNARNLDDYEKGVMERKILNSQVQSACNDYLMFCAVTLSKLLPTDVKLANTIHDCLIYYIPKDKLETVASTIRSVFNNPPIGSYFDVEIPKGLMVIDMKYGENWGELKTINYN